MDRQDASKNRFFRVLRWFSRRIKEPLPPVFRISPEELPQLHCRVCGRDLHDQRPKDMGGGPFVKCPECKATYFLKP